MSRTLLKNTRVFDGSGAGLFPADVLIEDDRIRAVARSLGQLEAPGAEVVDAKGMTLMPGMVEGHAHITFINGARSTDLGDTPPEEHTLIAARNARLLLDHGFTSAYSAASAKLRIDVVIRNAIEAGDLPGPRLRACGPEITVTGGLGDERQAHQFRDSFAIVAYGPVEVTKLARLCVREGVDSIKLNISGDDHTRTGSLPRTVMSDEEIRAGVTVARDFHRMVNAHCRAAEAHTTQRCRCGCRRRATMMPLWRRRAAPRSRAAAAMRKWMMRRRRQRRMPMTRRCALSPPPAHRRSCCARCAPHAPRMLLHMRCQH